MLLGGAGGWVLVWGGFGGCEELLIWLSLWGFGSSFLFISELFDTCESLKGCFV